MPSQLPRKEMEDNVEKKVPCMNATKLSGKQMNIPEMNVDDMTMKKQSDMVVPVSVASTMTQASSMSKFSSEKRNCLCSPTTHVGSFRCRHHRAGGMRHASSVGSNLSAMGSKHSLQYHQ